MDISIGLGIFQKQQSGGPAPSPVTSGLVMWLDALDASTFTLNGSRVDEWRCKAGTGNKVATTTNGTSYNPTKIAGYVRFVNKLLETPAAMTGISLATGFTVLAALKKTNRNSYFIATNVGVNSIMGTGQAERMGYNGSGSGQAGIPKDQLMVMGTRYNNTVAARRAILSGNLFACSEGTFTGAITGTLGKFGLGGMVGSTFYGDSDIAGVILYDRVLSDAEITQASAWLSYYYNVPALPTSPWNVVIDGNSLSVGHSGQTVSALYDGFLESNLSPNAQDVLITGRSGKTTPTLTTEAPTRVDPLYNPSYAANRRILMFWEINNDLASSAVRTDVQAYNNVKTYCQARKAVGWKVIVATCTPRTAGGSNVNPNYETYRLSVNQMIRDNAIIEGWADAIADIGGDATIGVTGANANLTYYADGLHLTAAGHAIGKTYVTTAFNTVSA